MRKVLPCLLLLLFSCQKHDYLDGLPEGSGTIEDLKNDISFVVGKWELTYYEPTYNSRSWIVFSPDLTYTAYFTFPQKPYVVEPSGSYSYSDCVISCKDEDGTTRILEFVSITGKTTANKIRHTYKDASGNTQTLLYEWCKNVSAAE